MFSGSSSSSSSSSSAFKILADSYIGKRSLVDLGSDVKTILEWILQKCMSLC